MAFWGQIAEWGANTVAPAVVGLGMEAQKHAEQVAEWGAKEVAPRAIGLAMEAQKHAEQVTPAVMGLAMNTKEHAQQISGHVAHWSNHHFVPAATGLAHNAAELAKNAERHYEQASPDQRTVIRGLISVGLTVVAEGFGIPLLMVFIGPALAAAGLGTGKALEGRNSESGASQASQPSCSARSGRPVVNWMKSGTREARKDTGNGAINALAIIATNPIVLESIVGLMAWLL